MEIQPQRVTAGRVSELLKRELHPQPHWIEGGLLPKGGTLLLGAHPKVGKSFIVNEFARALSTGSKLFGFSDFHAEQCRVLLVEYELGEYTLQKRLSGVFERENPAKYGDFLYYVSKQPALSFDAADGRTAWKEIITDVKPNVVIIDPLGKSHGWDENDNSQMGRLFKFLEQLKAHFKSQELSFVISHHFRKPPEGKFADEHDPLAMHNFRGANRFFSDPDTLITAARGNRLSTPWQSWEVKMRFITRHEAEPDEMVISVNRDNDGRVWYERTKGKIRPVAIGGPKDLAPDSGDQGQLAANPFAQVSQGVLPLEEDHQDHLAGAQGASDQPGADSALPWAD